MYRIVTQGYCYTPRN